jgi:hypothetical protein
MMYLQNSAHIDQLAAPHHLIRDVRTSLGHRLNTMAAADSSIRIDTQLLGPSAVQQQQQSATRTFITSNRADAQRLRTMGSDEKSCESSFSLNQGARSATTSGRFIAKNRIDAVRLRTAESGETREQCAVMMQRKSDDAACNATLAERQTGRQTMMMICLIMSGGDDDAEVSVSMSRQQQVDGASIQWICLLIISASVDELRVCEPYETCVMKRMRLHNYKTLLPAYASVSSIWKHYHHCESIAIAATIIIDEKSIKNNRLDWKTFDVIADRSIMQQQQKSIDYQFEKCEQQEHIVVSVTALQLEITAQTIGDQQ